MRGENINLGFLEWSSMGKLVGLKYGIAELAPTNLPIRMQESAVIRLGIKQSDVPDAEHVVSQFSRDGRDFLAVFFLTIAMRVSKSSCNQDYIKRSPPPPSSPLWITVPQESRGVTDFKSQIVIETGICRIARPFACNIF